MDDPPLPLPVPRGEENRYFADLREHRLPFYRCGSCDHVEAHPFTRCPVCGGADATRAWSVGRGRVHSYTTVHRPGHPAFAARVPYVVALVEVDEGFRTLADLRLDGMAPRVDQPVTVAFEQRADDVVLPYFVPQAGTR